MPNVPAAPAAAEGSTLANPGYQWLSAVDAARDPRTPDSYLLKLGLQGADQFFAMAARRPQTRDLTDWLISLASGRSPLLTAVTNDAVLALLDLPDLTTRDLSRLCDGLNRFVGGDFVPAAAALSRHPAADETVAAKTLCIADGGFGSGAALEQMVGSAGHLSATALRLLRLESPRRAQTTPRQTMDSTLDIVEELDALIGDRPTLRRAVAALGPTWSDGRASLLDVAAAVVAS